MGSPGIIQHYARARQLIEFKGMVFERGISPTDIDAFLDFGGKLFFFFEVKSGETPVPYGQKLAMERICDAMALAGECVYIIARHDTPAAEAVVLYTCRVSEYRWKNKWHRPEIQKTVMQFLTSARERMNL
jgi:hypothetical protein